MRASLPVGLLVVLIACACGGRVNSGDDGGSSPGGSSGSSSGGGSGATEAGAGDGTGSSSGTSSGVTVPLCPINPPTPGASCPGTQGCVYLEPGGCRAFVCDDTGVWQTTTTGC